MSLFCPSLSCTLKGRRGCGICESQTFEFQGPSQVCLYAMWDQTSSVCTAGPQPDLPSSVCTAGPQPGTFLAQCAPLDLNRDLPSSVCTAGPQPGTFPAQCAPLDLNLGPSQLSVHRWTSTWDLPSSVCTAGPQRPDRMTEGMPDRMSNKMPEDMPDRVPEDIPEQIAEDMPARMPENMPDRMPEDMPDKMPEGMSDRMPDDLPVTKCINAMVGKIRSKVIRFLGYIFASLPFKHIIPIVTNLNQFNLYMHPLLLAIHGIMAMDQDLE